VPVLRKRSRSPAPARTSKRYTPPSPTKAPPSKLWVPVTMFTLLLSGVGVIIFNYLQLFPWHEATNNLLFLGLGLFTCGALLSTQYR
jgi:hypothetical protein